MNRKPLKQKLEVGDYVGMFERLINEVERLENVLAVSQATNKRMAEQLVKAEHDRDRYYAKLKEYEAVRDKLARAGIHVCIGG